MLGTNNGAGRYFGQDGIGRFPDGSYAADQEVGGMLGYVQSDDCDTWAGRLAAYLEQAKHQITKDGGWTLSHLIGNLTHTFSSKHRRPSRSPPIEILHTLLAFHE